MSGEERDEVVDNEVEEEAGEREMGWGIVMRMLPSEDIDEG